ncbi:MAG: hypothetical protein V4757_19715 [Pseudomonadota bacterium]
MQLTALFFTVLLLISMGFFMMGSLPLLVLKHDTPLDARFIRGLFDVYYKALMTTATLGAFCYVFAERPTMAVVLGCVAVLGVAGRQWFVTRMDGLRSIMTAGDRASIRSFRQLHIAGMVLNVALLGTFCLGMAYLRS